MSAPRAGGIMKDQQDPHDTQVIKSVPAQATPTVVDIPGGVRTDFPNGSYLIEGPDGSKYLVSESGEISITMPMIRRVQIGDLAQVVRHDIAVVYDTISHTLHFAGGGVFSYLHKRDGDSMSIQSHNIRMRTLPDGVLVVCGTYNDARADAEAGPGQCRLP